MRGNRSCKLQKQRLPPLGIQFDHPINPACALFGRPSRATGIFLTA
jgi:hypothetical protein